MTQRALVLLHGFEDDPSTLDPLAAALDPNGMLVTLRPVGPFVTGTGPAWFVDDGSGLDPRAVSSAVAVVHAAIRSLVTDHATPTESIILAAFSQGAALGLAAALHPDAPGPLAELVLLAPFLLPPDITTYDFTPAPVGGVRMVHGDHDEVVPAPMGRSAAKLLERRGVTVAFTVAPGVGHDLDALATHAHPTLGTVGA